MEQSQLLVHQSIQAEDFGNSKSEVHRYNNKTRIIRLALIISISALMYGYSLKEITSVPIQQIINHYHLDIDPMLLQGVLIAIMPFGGIFGSILAHIFNSKIRRITGLHASTFLLLIAIAIVQITAPPALFLGRFLEGISIGYYTTISPIYLREITPKELRFLTGTFFSLGKILGVLLVIILELLFESNEDAWRYLLSTTLILAILQSILMKIFGLDTPVQLIEKKQNRKALGVIRLLYKAQYVDEVMQEFTNDYQVQIKKSFSSNNFHQSRKNNAKMMGIQICILRHFTGVNALIVSAGTIISQYDTILGKWTPLIINSLLLCGTLAAVFYISKQYGKRFQIILSVLSFIYLNGFLILSLLVLGEIAVLISISIYMVIAGAFFFPPAWSYPSEIVPAAQTLHQNIAQWFALSISTLLPPFVMYLMPNNNSYPIFIFFGLYCLMAIFYLHKKLVETKGKSFQQIMEEFK